VVDVEGQLIVGIVRSSSRRSSTSSRRGEEFLIDFSQTATSTAQAWRARLLSKKMGDRAASGLANLNDDLQTLFELTKLDTLFQSPTPASAR